MLLLLMLSAGFAHAQTSLSIAGWVERIQLVDSGFVLKAKLDTGAKTSSMHAKNIERFSKGGKPWVSFDIFGSDGQRETVRVPLERNVKIKNHQGGFNYRPVVRLAFCFDGQPRSASFTLTDRERFIYPVLLGRRFLKGEALVDSAKTFLLTAACQSGEASE